MTRFAKIRLKEVAERAGVSIMTVSKVMRDAPDVSPATKVRIRALAQQMGYVPDSTAQGLRTRATRLVGLVIPAASNPYYARLVMGVEEMAHELGYEVILTQSLNLPEREETAIRRLIARRVEGLVVSPVYRLAHTAPAYDELQRRGIPTVILGSPAPFCGQFPHVGLKEAEGSAEATRYLLSLGHRRIAYFAGPPLATWAQERLEGYRGALREAQIEPDDRLIFTAGSSIEDGELAASQMLQEALEATAVQAVNDLVAIGGATVLLNHNLRIPADLSVVGFGNLLMSGFHRVALTTVHQPKHRVGVAALSALVSLIRGQPIESRRLPTQLLVRASTGPPRVSPPPTPPTTAPSPILHP
jgi:DNA-binding LacI/PurR family transcriptional regulator